MTGLLPYGRQQVDEDDIAAVVEVLRGDYLTTGPTVLAFEQALAQMVGARYAVSCSSGTAALHLAAMALDLGPGDAVVVPAMTFLATANAVRYVGAEVIFADVNPETGLLEADHLDALLSRQWPWRVRAVFPVHLNGQCVDMVACAAVAQRHGVTIVEDGCHALGASFLPEERPEGRIGACHASAMTAFSFHPVKAIAMGEGGAITLDSEAHYDRLLRLRSHGMVHDPARMTQTELVLDPAEGQPNPWYYEMPEYGYNYRASAIHCALGLSQLGKLPRFLARRRHLAALYDTWLRPLAPYVRPVPRVAYGQSAFHLYAVLIDFAALGRSRAQVMHRLRAAGIGTQVHYTPVAWQPYYRQRYGELSLPGATGYYERVLSLPLFPGMDDADVVHVVEALAAGII